MKIKLQVNGENLDLIGKNEEMADSEYEVIINDIDIENITKLEEILNRAINGGIGEIFNSNTVEIQR